MTTLIRGIGELFTNDPQWGDRFGIIRDAAVEESDGIITWVGLDSEADTRELTADEVIDAYGQAIIPAFVDSHTHIAFAGDRAAEFEARMRGEKYAAGGIRSTVAATRAAEDDLLRANMTVSMEELAQHGTATVEIKSGYGLDVETEARLCRLASEFTTEVTFLGAHVVPAEYVGREDEYVDLVCGPMLDACAPFAKWIDVFCETGAFTVEQARRVLEAGISRGLSPRIHASQLAAGGGVALAVELGAASVDHGTYLTETDIELLAESDVVLTVLPGVEFSTRHPYPNARNLIDRGITVAISTDCNPGSSFTASMAFCIALAVREMGMTPAEAVWAATAGGAAALHRTDVGVIAVGNQALFTALSAPSHIHLAYRPGTHLTTPLFFSSTL
ncbi:MAG: Imidazolonepropionase [Actinomycetota bacterium]|jgi:imidazolonepropionase